MEEADRAARDLERIRALMERAGQYSHLSAAAAVIAGALAMGGAVLCKVLPANFNHPWCAVPLLGVWGGVFALSLAQSLAFHAANCRRKGEPAWSPLSRQVALAMLPAALAGGAITVYGVQVGRLDLLPPVWMLAYGSSLMGLGLYAGEKIQVVGLLYLLLGSAGLWWWREYGLRLMFAGFGGLHILLGALIAWKPRRSAA